MSERVDKYLAAANRDLAMSAKEVLGMVAKEDLPELHAIIRDGTRRSDWCTALLAITLLEEPRVAFKSVVEHIQRVRDTGMAEFDKVGCVVYLGYLGKEVSGAFLRRAVTHEGAQEVLAPWRESGYRNMDDLEISFRGCAASGIVLLEDDEGLAIVRQEYRRLRAIPPNERQRNRVALWLLPELRQALAVYDMSQAVGHENAVRTIVEERRSSTYGGSDSLWPFFKPYVEEEQAMWGVDDYGP